MYTRISSKLGAFGNSPGEMHNLIRWPDHLSGLCLMGMSSSSSPGYSSQWLENQTFSVCLTSLLTLAHMHYCYTLPVASRQHPRDSKTFSLRSAALTQLSGSSHSFPVASEVKTTILTVAHLTTDFSCRMLKIMFWWSKVESRPWILQNKYFGFSLI